MNKNILKICLLSAAFTFTLALYGCTGECMHTSTTSTVVEPTHEKQGRTVYRCNNCNYEYSADFVPPKGHHMQKEVFAPTCDKQGYTYNFCKCGYHFNSDEVEPKGHTMSLQVTAPTCEEMGYTVAACTACGVSYKTDITVPLGHQLNIDRGYVSINSPTSSSHFSCSRCSLDYVGDYLYYNEVYQGGYVDNTEVLCKGLDVSKHQHDQRADKSYIPLDWVKIKEQGFEFVILRAGYMGSGNVFVVDPVFEMNYADAKAAGLGVGAYIYSYAYTVDDAHAEALAMLEVLKGKQFEYPIYFDIEYSNEKITEKSISPMTMTYICKEFISTMQENGYFTALYTNNDWLTKYLLTERVTNDFDIWYARYAHATDIINEGTWNPSWGKQMPMWQFSQTGTIEGLNRNFGDKEPVKFDLNYCYKDYPSIIKKFGLNGFPLTEGLPTE